MEAVKHTTECALDRTDRSTLANIDHATSAAAIAGSTTCAKLLLSQGRSASEFYSSQHGSHPQRRVANHDHDHDHNAAVLADVVLQERTSTTRSGSDQNEHKSTNADMDTNIEMDDDEHRGVDGAAARIAQALQQAPGMAPYNFPLPPTTLALATQQQYNNNYNINIMHVRANNSVVTPTPPSSSSSSHHHSSPKHFSQTSQQPYSTTLRQSPTSMATITITPATESTLPSPLPARVRAHKNRERALVPPNASDVSEVPLDAFAEGEVLEIEVSDHDNWDHPTSPYHYSATQLRVAGARCSSSTLFDESRPSSGQGSWHKHDGSDSERASPVLFHPAETLQQKNSYGHPTKKQAIVFADQQQKQQQQQQNRSSTQAHSTDDNSNTNSCANSPIWTAGARLKIEPSTPVRPNTLGTNQQGTKGSSSPLVTPTTPLTPIPAELDKPTKNLMIFNKIPRQWPASQETLHHNFVVKGNKKTPIIKEFDPATAERIDRVINKERPLSRAAKERLAAEQKEAELEARGFFDPARRWKGRDVYPRPANWVYCRRTKNNWLEKTKILADQYKLFKSQVLGKGHHADVYKGVDLTTGQDLAIKVIYKTVTRRLGFVNEDPMQEVKNRRLLNEAWFIDYLKEAPGICKVLRVVETATKFYFVMELAQSDLNSYSNGINMREEEIRHILKPIFECLKFAHSQDITHRDIKPENILLRTHKDWLRNNSSSSKLDTLGNGSKKGKHTNHQHHYNNVNIPRGLHHIDADSSSILSSTFANESSYMDMDTTDGRSSMDSSTLYNYDHRFDASLADWGLAVEHDCNSGRKPVGTPLYAAPEVVRKMKRIRRREWINYRACDIWSLGVTMFVVASGIYPYHTHDALEAQSPPNWAALESSGMSREYIAFTQRLMNLTAELRPSAAEACNDPWLQG